MHQTWEKGDDDGDEGEKDEKGRGGGKREMRLACNLCTRTKGQLKRADHITNRCIEKEREADSSASSCLLCKRES